MNSAYLCYSTFTAPRGQSLTLECPINPRVDASISIEENHLQTYMKLLKDCRNVAVRVFPRYREMFPEGLKSMYSFVRPWQMPLKTVIWTVIRQIFRLEALHCTNLSPPAPQQLLRRVRRRVRGLHCKRAAHSAPEAPQPPVLGSEMGTADDPPPSFGRYQKRRPNIAWQVRHES